MFRPSSAAVATSREGQRSPRSGHAHLRQLPAGVPWSPNAVNEARACNACRQSFVRWEALIPADGSPPPEWKEGKMDEVEQADELGRRIISRAARVYDEKLMT